MPKPEIEAFLADQGFVPPTFNNYDHQFHGQGRCTQKIHVEQANCIRGPRTEIPSDEQYIFENGHAPEDGLRTNGKYLG
ncbi:MAG: hypothetical protein EZS28_053225 [Streblomastix strix]|uniref:Uncharacterized protein n=1 Tax=Streblomastix strix TaxID=222440 RepID=A0A5J4RH64_9EUKA|nr:MAG: hypothetical protein EZS28_053225 [Streblomastix strix]